MISEEQSHSKHSLRIQLNRYGGESMTSTAWTFAIVALIVGLLVGVYVGYQRRLRMEKIERDEAHETAAGIIAQANKDADSHRKEVIVEAKEEAQRYRSQVENELKQRRDEIQNKENRLFQREENLDRRDNTISDKEKNLESKEQSLQDRSNNVKDKEERVEQLLQEREEELERVSRLSQEQARELILQETESSLAHEVALRIRRAEEEVKEKADKVAKSIILQAVQTSGADTIQDSSITRVDLPNDDMKGRIIGKDGRNIKTLEALTGIDLIVDDTPETVVLSGFDPIRREIAKLALDSLIKDGRIHPAKIEEAVERARKEMDTLIRDTGEEATFDLGIHDMHPDLVKLVGRMNYRTSYGQNVLNHSIEVARLSGTLAAELGEDEALAKRAGLLHDIGKSVDHEIEGTHVQIGTELARKYHENPIVVNAIAAHHNDVASTSAIAVIIQVADALSAARPGARSESLENYIQRLRTLEDLTNSFKGVKESYAIQAGREVRVIVKPNEVDDLQAIKLSHDLSKRIEQELDYPGQVKVTVIRETRSVDYAR